MVKKWIQKMGMKAGALHKMLGVPMDKPIPMAKMAKAIKSTNTRLRKMAILAKTLKKISKKRKK
mgnify:CR=1 FL=1